MIGETLDGKYRMIRLIGKGGMGSVYKAEHVNTGLPVAVKIIHGRHLTPGKKDRRRFRREARAASAIGHHSIVKILDTGDDAFSGASYMVMELLSGEDLQQLIDRIGPLSPDVALRIVAQVLKGLVAAHQAKIVHRDIKPANIFLARGEYGEVAVKILDFGIAKIKADPLSLPRSADLTTTGVFLGSPLYMSPEQIQGSKDVDYSTDIWSVGSVLYCALSGHAPYQHISTLGQLILAICASPPAPIQNVAPWVWPGVAALVDGALRISLKERYQSASLMLEALEPLLSPEIAGGRISAEMLVPLRNEERSVAAPRLSPRIVVKPPSGVSEVLGDATTAPVQDTGFHQRVAYYDVLETLEEEGWNQDLAAQRLGISPRMLVYKMKLFGISKPEPSTVENNAGGLRQLRRRKSRRPGKQSRRRS